MIGPFHAPLMLSIRAVAPADQTVTDEASIPFGGVGASGTGSRHGGAQANIEAFTET